MINGNTALSQENAITYLNNAFAVIGYELKAVADETGIAIKNTDETNTYALCYAVTATSNSYSGHTLYYNEGNSYIEHRSSGSASGNTIYDIYYCSNGVLIYTHKSGGTVAWDYMFISKNDDNKYVFGGMAQLSTFTVEIATYDGLSYATSIQTFNAHPNTIMNNLPVYGGINDICYTQYVYTMQERQYSDSGKLILNGDEYISNGYWAIKN